MILSTEFANQFFLQGNKDQFIESLSTKQNSLTFNERIVFIESLIYLNDLNNALSQLESLEVYVPVSKKDQRIMILMLKAMCFVQPSDKKIAFKFLDEAEQILSNIKNSTIPLVDEQIKFLFTKGQVYFNFSNLDESLKSFQDCLHESIQLNNKFYQARSLNRLAKIYFEMERFERAIEHSMQALAIATANKYLLEVYLGYEMLGLVNQNRNKDQSIKYFEQCLKISMKQLQNDVLTAKSLMNIGKTKLLQKELDEANSYWNQSLNFYSKAAYNVDKPVILKNLGDLFSRKGNYNQALEHYKNSLELSPREDVLTKGTVLFAMGSVYFRMRDLKNALKFYSDSLELKKKITNKINLAGPLWGIGHVHFIKKNYSRAMEYYLQLFEIYKEYGRAEYTSETLLIIITLQHEIEDDLELKKYLQLLEQLVNQNINEHTTLAYSIAKALSGGSSRLIDLSEKLDNFKKILSNLGINQHFTFFALLNIILIYLTEYELTSEPDILTNIRETIDSLILQAIKTNSYPLELFANLFLIQLNYLEGQKENNRPLAIKITSLLDLVEIKEFEDETTKVLKKIDRLEKRISSENKKVSQLEILNSLGLFKLVKKIINDKYWL